MFCQNAPRAAHQKCKFVRFLLLPEFSDDFTSWSRLNASVETAGVRWDYTHLPISKAASEAKNGSITKLWRIRNVTKRISAVRKTDHITHRSLQRPEAHKSKCTDVSDPSCRIIILVMMACCYVYKQTVFYSLHFPPSCAQPNAKATNLRRSCGRWAGVQACSRTRSRSPCLCRCASSRRCSGDTR